MAPLLPGEMTGLDLPNNLLPHHMEGLMHIETGSTEELVRRAVVGGGFKVEASQRATEELVRIASAASRAGGRVVFFGLNPRPFSDLLRIVAAGGWWEGRIPSIQPAVG
jgi:hypothetical protein